MDERRAQFLDAAKVAAEAAYEQGHPVQRLNAILDRVADNDLSIKVHAIDERRLIAGLEKIANRITLGLILAALVVGAAMLMSVPTTFKIFGYPGIAMIFFLAAAAGGIALVVSILMYDVKHPDK